MGSYGTITRTRALLKKYAHEAIDGHPVRILAHLKYDSNQYTYTDVLLFFVDPTMQIECLDYSLTYNKVLALHKLRGVSDANAQREADRVKKNVMELASGTRDVDGAFYYNSDDDSDVDSDDDDGW